MEARWALLVEDDRPLRWLLKRILEARMDLKVNESESYEEAEDRLSERTYALVVTDCELKTEKTGFDLLRLLQRLQPAVPAVMMSGNWKPHSALLARRLGASAILRKPFELEGFVRACRESLGGGSDGVHGGR